MASGWSHRVPANLPILVICPHHTPNTTDREQRSTSLQTVCSFPTRGAGSTRAARPRPTLPHPGRPSAAYTASPSVSARWPTPPYADVIHWQNTHFPLPRQRGEIVDDVSKPLIQGIIARMKQIPFLAVLQSPYLVSLKAHHWCFSFGGCQYGTAAFPVLADSLYLAAAARCHTTT